jgi:hypothetical protein
MKNGGRNELRPYENHDIRHRNGNSMYGIQHRNGDATYGI